MGSEGFEATESLGAAFMGLVISAILFGITTLQVYIYYQYYPEDKLQNRIVVPLLWIVDVFHLALIIHACYIYLVNQVSLDVIIWSMRGELLVTELIAVAVTTLYTTRIWNFARKPRHHLLWLLVVAQLLQLAAAIIEIYACYVCATLADMDRYLVEIRFGLTAHAFVDCFLAAVMCYYLQIGRTGFSAMDGTVVKLMQYVVSSGLATAICAVATIIATTVSPRSVIWTVFYYPLPELYINSFLAFLNARRNIRRRMEEPSPQAPGSDIYFAGAASSVRVSFQSTPSRHDNGDKDCRSLGNLNEAASSEGSSKDNKPELLASFAE